jgi:hypothetical protein
MTRAPGHGRTRRAQARSDDRGSGLRGAVPRFPLAGFSPSSPPPTSPRPSARQHRATTTNGMKRARVESPATTAAAAAHKSKISRKITACEEPATRGSATPSMPLLTLFQANNARHARSSVTWSLGRLRAPDVGGWGLSASSTRACRRCLMTRMSGSRASSGSSPHCSRAWLICRGCWGCHRGASASASGPGRGRVRQRRFTFRCPSRAARQARHQVGHRT